MAESRSAPDHEHEEKKTYKKLVAFFLLVVIRLSLPLTSSSSSSSSEASSMAVGVRGQLRKRGTEHKKLTTLLLALSLGRQLGQWRLPGLVHNQVDLLITVLSDRLSEKLVPL